MQNSVFEHFSHFFMICDKNMKKVALKHSLIFLYVAWHRILQIIIGKKKISSRGFSVMTTYMTDLSLFSYMKLGIVDNKHMYFISNVNGLS